MLTMAEVENIREMYFNKGLPISRIARETGRDRKTIRDYLLKDDWNENLKETVSRFSKIDRYKATIDEWLELDRRMRKKQCSGVGANRSIIKTGYNFSGSKTLKTKLSGITLCIHKSLSPLAYLFVDTGYTEKRGFFL